MSYLHEDVENLGAFLRLAVHFLHDRNNLKRAKIRDGKALVSMTFPFHDIVFAAGGVPVVPIRMHEFKTALYLDALSNAGAFLGWDNTAKLLRFARQFRAGHNLVKNAIHEIVDCLFKKYNEMAVLAEETGFGADACYGIKGLFGMFQTKGQNLALNLNFDYRCSAYIKFCETLNDMVPRSHYVELPTFLPGGSTEDNLQFMMREIEETIGVLEQVTGNSVTQDTLRDTARLTNECRQYYKDILINIGKGDFWPCNPSTFSEILTLLNASFSDCCSNLPRYRDDLKALAAEMHRNIANGIGMDVAGYKKIVMQPIFGGYEPQVQDLVYDLGGRVYYGEWYALGFLDDIALEGDMIRNYALYYLHTSDRTGCSNRQMQDSFLDLVRVLDADGVVYNQAFGCRDMTACFRYYRDRLTKEMGVPVALVTFTKMGEGLEQVKTRVQALMEML
ncbi:MAG TPA: 2-hydroxyacyl-CoA dehydratase family protein [Candidatus Lokiarchaeia archaeon]|nr:2-hydroxyacyl-CoA dehydratase family protein [Candidatus Lokiarchaeia archaeon]